MAITLCEAEKNPFSIFAVGSKENTLKDEISTLTKLGVEKRTINAVLLDRPSINGQQSL